MAKTDSVESGKLLYHYTPGCDFGLSSDIDKLVDEIIDVADFLSSPDFEEED
jgi:hypothetical protein